jgi:hypothetical protein
VQPFPTIVLAEHGQKQRLVSPAKLDETDVKVAVVNDVAEKENTPPKKVVEDELMSMSSDDDEMRELHPLDDSTHDDEDDSLSSIDYPEDDDDRKHRDDDNDDGDDDFYGDDDDEPYVPNPHFTGFKTQEQVNDDAFACSIDEKIDGLRKANDPYAPAPSEYVRKAITYEFNKSIVTMAQTTSRAIKQKADDQVQLVWNKVVSEMHKNAPPTLSVNEIKVSP